MINISYGALAGQKDGGKFIEHQIRQEVVCAAKLGLTVHVVYAFGNSRNLNQIARLKVPAGETLEAPFWIIPRDTPLPSYLEIRAVDRSDDPRLKNPPDAVEYKLIDPNNEALTFCRLNGHATFPTLTKEKHASVARFYDVPERSFPQGGNQGDAGYRPNSTGVVQIAVAPTVSHNSDLPVAEAGDWKLSIFNLNKHHDLDLVLQIQRGDTAPGFVIGGRQSQFAGTFSESNSDPFPVFDVDPPVTNSGTNSAYTTAIHPQILTAGAQQNIIGTIRDADYSALGAGWTPQIVPSDKEVVDCIFTNGRLVSGTYSGTLTRLSGTSAAAALVSRKIIR